MLTTRSNLPSRQPKAELEAERARRALKLLLTGFEGAVLTHVTTIDADFRARIRFAAHKTRRTLEAGTPAHAALLEHIAPLFTVTPGAKVGPVYGDDE